MTDTKGSAIWIVIGVILFSIFIGWFNTAINDKTTLREDIANYKEPNKGNATTGQTLAKDDTDTWSLWSIPLLGPILSILIGILNLAWTLLTTFFTGLNALLILPTYLPAFAQTVLNWVEIGIVSILILAWLHGD